MFKNRFDCKSKPLATDSNMECVYEYGGLSHDEVRIMKKLLSTHGSSISLKAVESCAESDNGTKSKKKKRKTKESEGNKPTERLHSSTSSVSSSECSDRSSVDETPDTESPHDEIVSVSSVSDTRDAVIREVRMLCTRMHSLMDQLEIM